MIRRTMRLAIRLGLLGGIGFALFKVAKDRRAAFEYGSPSADWTPTPAPAPASNPNLPKPVPEPPLVTPVELVEILEKKAAGKTATPEPAPAPVPPSAPPAVALVGESAVRRTPSAKTPAAKTPPAK
ncbi:MAG: hypothetical protein ABIW46_06235, partial [Acidimicrobiales bacterium]